NWVQLRADVVFFLGLLLTKCSPPDVQVFAKKSVRDSRKLILTCLITGFYHKDVKMSLRKYGTEIPDHLITSSEIGPNDDGTYQLRKSFFSAGFSLREKYAHGCNLGGVPDL
uniref:Immunoglobulin C1-set domain-containing protein n=1 Tax=Astyanax mexicanus TaxID=7994 RepID=A0A3B1IWU3_ASTMX